MALANCVQSPMAANGMEPYIELLRREWPATNTGAIRLCTTDDFLNAEGADPEPCED